MKPIRTKRLIHGSSNRRLNLHPRLLGCFIIGSCFGVFATNVQAVDVLASAVAGQPYGVAMIEIPIGVPVIGRNYPPLEVVDDAGRVMFPLAKDEQIEIDSPVDRPIPRPGGGRLLGRIGELVRELAGDGEPEFQTISRRVMFLFVGSQPIRVQLSDTQGPIGTYEIVPTLDPGAHGQLLEQWWSGYTAAQQSQIQAADYPTVVESYLVAMLARQTGMPLPDWYHDAGQEQDDRLLDTLKLIAGAEEIGDAIFRRSAAGTQDQTARVELPLPPSPQWKPTRVLETPGGVDLEPIAGRVPPECFYIRYGSFDNFLWFRDLSEEYGGDITHMLTLRGINQNAMFRIEEQLSMQMTQLSRMLGGTVVEDQAVVGRDLFMADGASMGVLIKAKNMFLLQTAVNSDRSKLAGSDPAITLKTVKIDNQNVTLLSTADHRIRSFMGVDGQYMFVSNSRTMMKRFFEVGVTGESLAATPSFQLARELMPLDRQDAIFAYFSSEMLQGLVSPRSLIELRRRLHARADITLVHLARFAAAFDNVAHPSLIGIDQLKDRGYLPPGFGDRIDGTGTVEVGDRVIDTLRGARGTFLPIADVVVDTVSPEESAWYQEIAESYRVRFPSFDPIMVGVQREKLEDPSGVERVTIHAEIAPWDPGKYGQLAEQLGPPTRIAMKFSPDDLVTVQAHVASALLGPPTHLFVGIKDSLPPEPDDFDGILGTYFSLKQIPGYLGAWPQPGALDRLPLGLGRGQPVGPGMTRLIGGLYRYADGQFSVLSFQPDILQSSLTHLQATESDDSAQVRLHVGNLRGSQLESWVNGQLYERSRAASVAGATYLEMLSRQLRIEPEQALAAADQILGAEIQCTLGGTYQPSTLAKGQWISTAWDGETAPETPPANYIAPLLGWLRGLDADLTQYDDRVVADAVMEMARD